MSETPTPRIKRCSRCDRRTHTDRYGCNLVWCPGCQVWRRADAVRPERRREPKRQVMPARFNPLKLAA